MMRKVLYFTYYWPPAGGPGVQRSLKFVKYLRKFGIDPIVITPHPTKASHAVSDSSLMSEVPSDCVVINTNTLEPFGIYERLTGKKEIPRSGFANESNPGMLAKIMRFVRGNFFIPDPRKGWNRYAENAALKIINTEKIDAIICSSPPHSTQLIGLQLQRKTGIPWIADMRDPWTDIYYYKQLYHTRIASWLDRRLERQVLTEAKAVVVVSKSMKRLFESKSQCIDPAKIHVIPNGFDLEDFPPVSIDKSSQFRMVYTGTMSDNYPVKQVLKAMSRLNSQGMSDINLSFFGEIAPGIKKEILLSDVASMVSFNSYLPHDEAIQKMRHSEMLLLIIPEIKDNEAILTGKLFEYLAAAHPILGIGPENGDAAQIIMETGSGTMFEYSKAEEVYQFIKSHYDAWRSGKHRMNSMDRVTHYSRESLSKQLAGLIISSAESVLQNR